MLIDLQPKVGLIKLAKIKRLEERIKNNSFE